MLSRKCFSHHHSNPMNIGIYASMQLTYENHGYLDLANEVHELIMDDLAHFKRFRVIDGVDKDVGMNIHTVGLLTKAGL